MGILSPRLEINGKALQANLAQIRKQADGAKVIAVIKANAYGHGALDVCKSLDADIFAVARMSEAMEIRDIDLHKRVIVLQGVHNIDELKLAEKYNLEVVVHHIEQLKMLEKAKLSQPIQAWIKMDTGMHRLGFLEHEFTDAYMRLQAAKCVAQPVHIMSHFACADEIKHPLSLKQIEAFSKLVPEADGDIALANSGAFLNFPQTYADYIRVGLILYGVSPLVEGRPQDFPFQPAMTLKSYLIAVRDHKKGEAVGYGATWKARKNTKLGVVSVGYADGYPRHVPSGTPVLIGNRRVPVVGRVSMDMLSVDLGPDAMEQVGDEVILWGEDLPVEDIALAANTIPYELMTKVTLRVKRLFHT